MTPKTIAPSSRVAAIGLFGLGANIGLFMWPPTTQLKVHCAQRGAWRPMLWCDVFGLLRSRRRDDADRRTFQSRCYGPAHTGTERLVHVQVTGVRYV
jgi:hypothetical protein